MRLARCFLSGLPTAAAASSGGPILKILGARVAGLPSGSIGDGDFAGAGDSVSVEAGDLRDAALRGSAECARLSYGNVSLTPES